LRFVVRVLTLPPIQLQRHHPSGQRKPRQGLSQRGLVIITYENLLVESYGLLAEVPRVVPRPARLVQTVGASAVVSQYREREPSLHLVQQSARLLGVAAMQKADLPARLVTDDLVPDAGLISDELTADTREGAGIPVQDSVHPPSSWLLFSSREEGHGGCLRGDEWWRQTVPPGKVSKVRSIRIELR
jgi:hypothetical protein